MLKIMKFFFYLVFIFCISSILKAQSAGNSGLSFLKFGFGARNLAMGDIGSVSANDVTSLNYNPAMLSEFSSSEILFTHNEWIQDVRSELFGASFKLLGLPFGVGINTTSVSDIEVRTRPGEAESNFNARFFSGSLSTGFNITNEFAFGATIKYLYEGMLSDDATGWGFDFGVHYNCFVEGLTFGSSIRNLGSMNQLRTVETKLPADLRIGTLYSKKLNSIKSQVSIGTEFQKYLDTDDTHINFGGEFFYDETIAVRAGYQTGYESKGISTGLGLKWNQLFFDYALVPFNYNLGTTHIISIKFKF